MRGMICGVFALVLAASLVAAKENFPPLPASVMAAKIVFIDNQTGHTEITDRAYDSLIKWGRFKISQEAKEADIVLRFTADTEGRPDPPHNDIDISPTPVMMVVLDAAKNELWSISKNKPFHSQSRLDFDEFRRRIQEQEKSK